MDTNQKEKWLVSPSQLKSFSHCPRAWWYKKVAGIPEEYSGKAAEIGSMIHEQIYNCIVFDIQPTHPAAKLALHQIYDKGHPTASEIELRWDIDDTVALRGFVDWMSVHRGSAIIIDHKTKATLSFAPTPEELRHDVQLLSYAWIVCQMNPEVEHIEVIHNVVTREDPVEGCVVPVSLKRDEVLAAGVGISQQCKELARQSKLPVVQVEARVGPACTMWRRRCQFEEQCIKDRGEEETIEW